MLLNSVKSILLRCWCRRLWSEATVWAGWRTRRPRWVRRRRSSRRKRASWRTSIATRSGISSEMTTTASHTTIRWLLALSWYPIVPLLAQTAGRCCVNAHFTANVACAAMTDGQKSDAFDAHCCHMGTSIKHHVPDGVSRGHL